MVSLPQQFELLSEHGKPVLLDGLWKGNAAVFGFVRHFGCVFCQEQVADLRRAEPEIQKRGGKLWVVGNGRPEHARGFADRLNMAGQVFTDPSRALYRALGMRGRFADSLSPALLSNAYRAFRRGFRQGKVLGDPWQQGGALVVSSGGKVVYLYVSRTAGDHPEVGLLMNALAAT